MSIITVEEVLYPRLKISGTTWTEDDPAVLARTTSGSPSCAGATLYYSEDDGNDDRVGYRLDPSDSYSYGFQTFEVGVYLCARDANQPTQVQFKIGSETFTDTFSNSTGFAQWFTFEFESVEEYSSSVLNFAELWIIADDRNHKDLAISAAYVKATGVYDIDQWDPDNNVLIGGCAGARHHKNFGGLEIDGESYAANLKLKFASGGVRVGEIQPRYAEGGLTLEGEAPNSNSIWMQGGAVAGGSAVVSTITAAKGGVYVGSLPYDNGYHYRIPITVPEAEEALFGVIIGFPVYLPIAWESFTVEDSTGNTLAYEIVSQQGLKISLFVKLNIKTEEQTIYLYGGS